MNDIRSIGLYFDGPYSWSLSLCGLLSYPVVSDCLLSNISLFQICNSGRSCMSTWILWGTLLFSLHSLHVFTSDVVQTRAELFGKYCRPISTANKTEMSVSSAFLQQVWGFPRSTVLGYLFVAFFLVGLFEMWVFWAVGLLGWPECLHDEKYIWRYFLD